jgi:Na+-driven multidrug efflux pump
LIAFWLFQLPLAYFASMTLGLGPIGIFVAITLAEVLLAGISILWFKKGNWKNVMV